MTESTAQQPAGSITDDLTEAFSGFDDDLNVIEEPSEDVEEIEETEPSEDVEPDEGEETGDTEEDVGEETPAIEAPSHWSAADKETFASAPPELQNWLLERHKAMEGDYTRKSQEVADIRKTWEPVQELFNPYMDQLRSTGQTPASVITHWANVNRWLDENPQGTLEWLANQYGVKIGEQTNDDFIDPHVQSLQQEIQHLKNQVVQRERYESQQRLSTVEHELQSFAEEKTEAGELAHPYFEEVVEDMARLARAEQAAGRNPKVGELYETAVWANPSVREKMLAAQQHAAAKKAEQEARAKAAKAKSAKKTIRSSPEGESSSELSLREELERAFN